MTTALPYMATLVLAKKDREMFIRACQVAPTQKIDVLATHKAFAFTCQPSDKAHIGAFLETHNIAADFCVQPTKTQKKTLLVCDMDSTIIAQESIDELASLINQKNTVNAITEAAMRGEMDFQTALKKRVNLLKNMDLSVLNTCLETRITVNAGARILVSTMRAAGAHTVMISGGFDFFARHIAAQVGFTHHHANQLVSEAGKLTGQVKTPILDRAAKYTLLKSYARKQGGLSQSMAIGDGANDADMIAAAGLGIAYYPKPALKQVANSLITTTDLTSALYFQGYKESEFVMS